jgi:hypothetical protein
MRRAVYLKILPGGLGNQLFQYAAGFAFARGWDLPLLIDASMFRDPVHPRPYRLDRFAVSAPQASADGGRITSQAPVARMRRRVDHGGLAGSTPSSATITRSGEPHPALGEPPPRRAVQVSGFWECATYAERGGEGSRRELAVREPRPGERCAGLSGSVRRRPWGCTCVAQTSFAIRRSTAATCRAPSTTSGPRIRSRLSSRRPSSTSFPEAVCARVVRLPTDRVRRPQRRVA